jgi:cyclopropane fatty-acyl-phospholipid synthase-like methyltransferase
MVHDKQVREFFDVPDNYLNQSFGLRIRAELVRGMIGMPDDKRFLDVGCGNGAISRQFTVSNHVTFLDISPNMIELAKQNVDRRYLHNATFLVGSFTDAELQSTFDYIFLIGVLAHVPSVADCLQRMASLLSEGGRAVVQFSDYNHWLVRRNIANSARYKYPINKLPYDEVKSDIDACGLEVEKETRFSFLLPGMGHLPDWMLYRYSKFVLSNRFLSNHGTDLMWLLRKKKMA